MPNKYKLKVLELIEACAITDVPTESPVVLNFIADTQQINELMNKIAQQDKVQLINRVSDKNLL